METILYINGSTDSGPYRMKLAGLKRYARMRKWSVKVAYCARGGFSVRDLLGRHHPVGVVVEACFEPDIVPAEEFGGLPVVYLDPSVDVGKSDAVVHKAAETVKCAIGGLSSAGVAHFAYAGWFADESWTARRERLFVSAMRGRKAGFSVFRSRRTEEEREAYLGDLSKWLKALPPNTGVLAANDAVAECVISCCRRLRIDIPRDLALVGVDNDKLRCEGTDPQIASVQLDFEQAGYLAGQLLDGRIAHPRRSRRVAEFGPLGLIRRASIRSSPVMGYRIVSAMEMIRARACEGLSALDVVKHIGGSRRSAEMRFRETIGKSILEEIMDVRFARIFYLLENTDTSFDALASFSGFADFEAMRKTFRRRTGLSPGEWRRSRRILTD